MTALYTISLVGIFCGVVLIWKIRNTVERYYDSSYNNFKLAIDNNCIIDDKWNTVLESWY